MARETEISALTLSDPAEVTAQAEHYRRPLDQNIITLTELGGGAIRFAEAAFPNASLDSIYAQHNIRESEGRGPHFDIYNENIDEGYPWLGVYNLAGSCAVRAAVMPDTLSEEYQRLYPEANEEAYEARRHFGALVLSSDASIIYSGKLGTGTGLILPQQKGGPNVIHEVVPEDSSQPGSFIKMVVPKNEAAILESLREQEFMPLDELLTKAFGEPEAEDDEFAVVPLQPPAEPKPSRRRRRGRGRGRRHDQTSGGSSGTGMLD